VPADVAFHPDAEDELRAAYVWYHDHNPLVAVSFRSEAEHAIEVVAEQPSRWPVFFGSIRRYVFPRFPFTLIYRGDSKQVQIIAVAHQKRRPQYWKQR